ncbi:MAG TPA: LysR family transcriptional regulator [Burkholderiaceae bacterium]|jgi:DNA-binding transcriptional LysR family regulator
MPSRISQRQLEYFIAAGNAGSIVGAAERIHVSAASISAAISHIESELRVQLFIRHHAQGLSLTSVGRLLLENCRRISAQLADLYTIASEAVNEIRGSVSLGCLHSLAPIIVPELVQGFIQDYPGVSFTHVEDHQDGLLDKLRHGQIDLAITYDLTMKEGFDFEPLAVLPPHVIVGRDHVLASRDAVSLEELADHPMVMLDMPVSREYFLSLFIAAGVTPWIRSGSGVPEVVRSMVANGMGYSLSNTRPKANVSLDGKLLRRVTLSGDHRPMRLGLATMTGSIGTRTTTTFLERCRTRISSQIIPGMTPAVEMTSLASNDATG